MGHVFIELSKWLLLFDYRVDHFHFSVVKGGEMVLPTMSGLVEALLQEALIDADIVSLGREKRVLEIALLSQTIHAYS